MILINRINNLNSQIYIYIAMVHLPQTCSCWIEALKQSERFQKLQERMGVGSGWEPPRAAGLRSERFVGDDMVGYPLQTLDKREGHNE